MREEVRDVERLNHMIEAINVLVNYKEHHTLEDAKSSSRSTLGDHCHRYSCDKADYRAVDSGRKVEIICNYCQTL